MIKMKRLRRGASLLAGMALAYSGIAGAQGTTAGQIREQMKVQPAIPATPTTPVVPEGGAPSALGVAPGGKTVLVERFEIQGNQAIPSAELEQVVAGYQGRPLSLAEIYEAADKITRYYRDKGYTLASATVPAQKISGGVVQLEVVEGRLGEVSVEGNRYYKSNFIRWQLDRLKTGEVLRNEPLEHELLLLNDMPGLQARAVVRPGTEYGTSDLVVKADEKLVDAGIRVNNYGRAAIGEWRLEGDAAVNGLLGYGDRLQVSGTHSEADRLNYQRISYGMAVSPWATMANVYYASYDYDDDEKLLKGAPVDLKGGGYNFGAFVSQPFWRSREKNLYFGVGYDRTVTDDSGAPDQQLSLALFNVLFDFRAPDGSYSTAGLTLSTNFEGMDRDPLTKRLEQNAETAKFQLDLSHYRTVYHTLALLTRVTTVVSVDPLADLDQFRIGGPSSVRAYPVSELSGDGGYFVSLELQQPFVFPVWDRVPTVAKAFIDTGRVYHMDCKDAGYCQPGTKKHPSQGLTGVGIGLQVPVFNYLLLDVALTHPIGARDPADGDGGARFWMNLSARY